MLTDTERHALIDQIQQLPQQLADLVMPLTADQLTTPYLAGEWTIAQNVHHLADSHMNSYIRCKLIVTEDRPLLKPYDQEEWARLPDAADADISVSLTLLGSLHARWTQFWEQLPDAAWERTGIHPEIGVVTLEEQLQYYAAHGKAHLDQIERTLAAQSTSIVS